MQQLANRFIEGADNYDETVKKLCDQYYELLPHKEAFKTDKWTLKYVIGKQDFCQVRIVTYLAILLDILLDNLYM